MTKTFQTDKYGSEVLNYILSIPKQIYDKLITTGTQYVLGLEDMSNKLKM